MIKSFAFYLTLTFVVCTGKPAPCAPPDSASWPMGGGLLFGYSTQFNRAVRTLAMPDDHNYAMEYGWMDGAMVSAGVYLPCRLFIPTLQVIYVINSLEGNYEMVYGSGTWYTESSLEWHDLGIELLVPACWKVGQKGRIFVGGGGGINFVLHQKEEVRTELLTDSTVVGYVHHNPSIPTVSWSIPITAGYSFPLNRYTALTVHLRYAFTPAVSSGTPFSRQIVGVGLTISRNFRHTFQPMDIRL